MLEKINFKFLFATALSFTLINEVKLQIPNSQLETWVNIGDEAFAKSSGGRGGGGSFRGGSRSGGSNSGSNSGGNSGYSSGGNTVIIAPGGGGYYGTGGGFLPMLLILGLFGIPTLGLIAFFLLSNRHQSANYANDLSLSNNGFASHNNELDNDIVTVTKLQVALFAHTKGLQSQLSKLTLEVDTSTPEGLFELLQESALVLLRNPENWSHVLASSETLSIDKADSRFNQLSLQERSKFSAETLTNVKGSIKQQEAVIPGLAEDPAAYIVVTLLVGTADDKPLFKEVRSAEALKAALERVASIPPEYLFAFEVLWSPQVEEDSLTYDELLTEYTDMVQIV
jgi:uncharacterized membrane protein